MYTGVIKGINRVKRESRFIRDMWKIQIAGQFVSVVSPVSNAIPTYFIIIVVSLLNEALELYIDANFNPPAKQVATLHNRICFIDLNKPGLIDPTKLYRVKNMRNHYAHDAVQYANWAEFDGVVHVVEEELKKLGIL